jgi:hypothetical protein
MAGIFRGTLFAKPIPVLVATHAALSREGKAWGVLGRAEPRRDRGVREKAVGPRR